MFKVRDKFDGNIITVYDVRYKTLTGGCNNPVLEVEFLIYTNNPNHTGNYENEYEWAYVFADE